jgi:multidrug efflux pump subunit AcrA (membrane-fusion protein)
MSRIVLLTAFVVSAIASAGRADEPWVYQGVVVPKINVTLRVPSPQTISEVVADVGDKVKKGDVLIRFDDRQARIDLHVAEVMAQMRKIELKHLGARMDAAKALVERQGLERDRLAKLPPQAASREEVRIAESEFKRLAADVAVIETQIELARLEEEIAKAAVATQQLKLEALTLRSPFDGMVVSRGVAPRELVVKPDQPLLEIIAGPHQVEVTLPDQLVPILKTGSTVYIETDSGKSYTAAISLISPVLDPRTRSVKVRVALPAEAETALPVGLVVRVQNQPAAKDPKEPKPIKD